jgi:hypothetical protein
VIKKVEVLVNIAILITSGFVCTLLAKKYFLPSSAEQTFVAETPQSNSLSVSEPRKQGIQVGTKISLPGIDWSSKRTVLLVLSTKRRFCTESAPFYRNLQQKKAKDVAIIAVFPQPVADSTDYLNEIGVSASRVVQAGLASVGVSGTPTLLLIDGDGIIRDSWVGKLSEGETEKVLTRIANFN